MSTLRKFNQSTSLVFSSLKKSASSSTCCNAKESHMMVMVLLLFLPNKLRFLKQQKLQEIDDPEDDFAKKQNTVSSAFCLAKSRMLKTLTYFENGDTATLSIIS